MSTETTTKLTLDVKTADGKTNGTVDLPAALFDAPANIALMHQVVVAQQAAARQGTHSTKTRGEVRGGGAKPIRREQRPWTRWPWALSASWWQSASW